MSISEKAKLISLAIVRIFETSKPFGDYGAVAVLNDGAGVSYGAYQFTHKSGSLYDVVMTYLGKGGVDGRTILIDKLPILNDKGAMAIEALSNSRDFKAALRKAGTTREMCEAQKEVAFKRYLNPAIEACEGSGFVTPLALAVVYDSMNHGSFAKIRDNVRLDRKDFDSDLEFEKAWIDLYVHRRDAWLESIPRLASTDYRTDFFLAQIARRNWNLDLPLNVHGHKLTENEIGAGDGTKDVRSENGSSETPQKSAPILPSLAQQNVDKGDKDSDLPNTTALSPQADTQSPNVQTNFTLGGYLKKAQDKFDGVNELATGVITRKDSAKSLWTTLGGGASQVLWAAVGLILGVPREVWLTVAVIVGALALLYLYRQISLGKIREQAKNGLEAVAARL
jgi:hypothetical protein